jgi:hypothetical protein
MKKQMSALLKLRGIGDVLSRRLVDSGIDSYEKIVALGEEGLRNIKGMNPRAVPGILAQAEELIAEIKAGKSRRAEELKQAAHGLREHVHGIAVDLKERFSEDLAGKVGKKMETDIMKLLVSLEKVEAKFMTRGKKAAKGIAKAEKRLEGLKDAGLVKVRKGLQKARKSLKRILA